MERSRGHLVLVDDDLGVQRLLAQALQLEGFEVKAAGDVDEGWEAIERTHPDLVVLDVMMPGADGFSLLRRVRETPRYRELLVVMLSARAQPDDIRRGGQAGADLYITKPFSIEQLVWHLDETLRVGASRRSIDQADPLDRLRRNGPLSMEVLRDRAISDPRVTTSSHVPCP